MSKSVSIDLGLPPYQKKFHNTDELEKWFTDERVKFAWIQEVMIANVNLDRDYLANLWKIINGWHEAIRKLIVDWIMHVHNDNELDETINAHKFRLLGGYRTDEILLSSSPDMEFVFALRQKRSGVVAAYALCFLMNLDVPSNKNATEGVFWALRYQEGNTTTVKAQTSALETLARDWGANVSAQLKKNQEAANDQHRSGATLISKLELLKDDGSAQLEKQRTDYASHKDQLAVDLEHTRQAFSMELAMKEPVSYWKTKRDHHQKVMWNMAIGTLIVAFVSISFFICAAYKFSHANVTEVPLLHASILLSILAGGVWLTRVCTKIFISNLHLRTDADERMTMCQTYLAMLALGKGLTETDRRLMLQTLFRPSSTGFIKDDGPAGVFELVKVLDRKGG